jgi:2-polyprenyl-3-methyl-5-hydroxy-6-metoxy-1,4-benzoquinol methylase
MTTPQIEQANRSAWTNALQSHQLVYPDERIVSFLASNYSNLAENKARHALDIGFASGRHCRLLRDYNFTVHGIDYIESAADTARKIYGDALAGVDLRKADLRDKPYPDESFDLILCWGVIFLRPLLEMETDLGLLRAMLKPNGRLLLDFRTKDSWFFAKGQSMDANTYVLDATAGPYNTMCYTFLDHAEATALLQRAGFSVDNSERLDIWKKRVTERHSWWVFWAQKPE